MKIIKVLALDQATQICGYCLMDTENDAIIKAGKLRVVGEHIQEKISNLKQQIIFLIDEYQPDYFILEDIQYQSNPKVYKTLAELLGVLENFYYENQKPYKVIPSSTWRTRHLGIKGSRNEVKKATIEYVQNKYKITVDSDTADAIGLAEYGCYLLK